MADIDDRREYDPTEQLPITITVTCGICSKRYEIDLTGFGWKYAEKFGDQMISHNPWCDECKEKKWGPPRNR